jgi:DNA-binding transcriptional LysR family regulator
VSSKLSDIEIFVRVVQLGSFTLAARELAVSKSFASKQVRALEERLGARLLNRTTRTLTPTDAGIAFARRCSDLLDEIDEAERAIAALQEAPRGTLRLTAPMTFGVRWVAPILASFGERHPDLHISADFTDRKVDLVEEGLDLAIRVGRMQDSSLVARKLAPVSGMLIASPAYLARRGTPAAPDDLRDHDCLVYSLLDAPTSWVIEPLAGGDGVRVRVAARMTSNNGDALLAAAQAGMGITALPDFMVVDALRSGAVVRVLPTWGTIRGAGVWALYPHSRHLAAKVRLFVDHLAESFSGVSWDDPLRPVNG